MFTTLPLVALGGAIGASLRYLVGIAALRAFGPGFPAGTLIVNLLGCLAMGILAALLADKASPRLAPFLMTGILGGFTTYSAFALETVALWQRGDTATAMTYVLATTAGSITAVLAGMALVRAVTA
ncbi:MAG: fluoride efflux transporter CrcB [Pseudomonadota bacterium]